MRSKKRIKPFMKWLTKEWEKSPDQRFGQLLVNLGIVADGPHWNIEMGSQPVPHEVMREIQTWGTYGQKETFGKKDIFIKDLLTDHIKTILKTEKHIGPKLQSILKEELKFRKKK